LAVSVLNRYLGEVGIGERYTPPQEPEPEAPVERPWATNDRIRHRVFGVGRVVGFIDQDILDIDFRGQRRSIKLGVVPLERVQ
jgi:DNA helicase II / ATP-dependent DNA helicase PcrA